MNQIKAFDLWQRGQVLWAQGRYKKGLVLLEKAADLNPPHRELLGRFYLDLYQALISGAVSSNAFPSFKWHQLWQRGKTLLAKADNAATGSAQAINVKEHDYPDKSPVGFYSGGPYEGRYRLKHNFKQQSLFAPIDPLKMEPVVEPDDIEILQQQPKSFPQKVLAFIKHFLLPLGIILIIELFIYGGVVFFVYFGEYMGWR